MNDTEKPPEGNAEGQTPASEGPDKAGRRDDRTRSKLRDVEAERDSLRERNARLVEAEVHRQLGERVNDVTAAMKLSDKAATDFVSTKTGEVDADAISDFAAEVVKAHPMLDRTRPPVGTALGETQTKVRPDQVLHPRQSADWSDVFDRQRRDRG